jgi:hypothetical protein
MDDLLTRLLTDYERGTISRRKLLRTLGMTAVGAPLAAALGTSAFGQGRCRDGYAQGGCPLTKEAAIAPIKPIFASTGWKTVALENIVFDVLDYKKEAAFIARWDGNCEPMTASKPSWIWASGAPASSDRLLPRHSLHPLRMPALAVVLLLVVADAVDAAAVPC